ncbi:DUF434 domain-containing protein [Clostridium paraputrificum]|uniref:DUF434 domain-containing protein n=1 Tax=Clostridium paraputrificum TaxID=29363 RepID=UPI003D328004
MAGIARRGFIPSDRTEFNDDNIRLLQEAKADICNLLDRGYSMDKTIEFIGNHYLLSSRQRLALKRSLASSDDIKRRLEHEVKTPPNDSTVHIDGLNLIITLEVALSGSTLLLGMDGAIRDLAGLRGTYTLIDKTDMAIDLIGKKLSELKVKKVIFYLDSPVSNTGKLKHKIIELLSNHNFELEVILVQNADVILNKLENVATSDGIILNSCKSWINLGWMIIRDDMLQLSYVDLR